MICELCNEKIYPGDEIAIIDGERYHMECIQGMSEQKFCNVFDVTIDDLLTVVNAEIRDYED